MTGFGKAVLSATIACVVLVAGHALADTQSFDLDTIEVQEDPGQAIIAMDVPSGSEVKAIDNPQRGEMTVTFTGVSVRLPKRVHAGQSGAILSSLDVEPWFIDGERVTRMVIRYPEGAQAMQEREGDILMVMIDAPEGTSEPAASVETEMAVESGEAMAFEDEREAPEEMVEAIADEAAESDVDDFATSVTPEAWSPMPSFVAAPVAVEAERVEEPVYDTAPETIPSAPAPEELPPAPAAGWAPREEAQAEEMSEEPSEAMAEDVTEEMSEEMAEVAAAPAFESSEAVAEAQPSTPPVAAPVAVSSPLPASAPVATSEESVPVPATRTGWYGDTMPTRIEANNQQVTGWAGDRSLAQDTQPALPAMDDGPTITIDLQGADVRTVLRSLSETSGWNIVANADVTGEVSLKLDDVPWRRALGVVLKTRGLDYVVEDGIIRVAKADALRAEIISRETAARKKDELVPLETSVVPVRFAAAKELVPTVQTLLSPRGKIKEDSRTNALIITDIPAVHPQVQGLVVRLDGKTPQVEIVAKLVDIDVSAVREMGINWGLNNLHSTGQAISANASVASPIGASAGTVNFGIIREFADLDLTLQALEQNQQANIISNPKITTVNNREARILVGQEIPLIVQDEAGNPITELKKIGIELRVTPYINQDGLITLDLHPEVSDLAAQSTAQGGVIINTSEADTRVMVANGETAVIGGLIRANETTFKSGVPVLHRLPIIGGLFGSETKTNAKRELVIFVTPRIIE